MRGRNRLNASNISSRAALHRRKHQETLLSVSAERMGCWRPTARHVSICGSLDAEDSRTVIPQYTMLLSPTPGNSRTATVAQQPCQALSHNKPCSPVGPGPLGCINRNQGLTGLRVGAQRQKTHTHTQTISLSFNTVHLLMNVKMRVFLVLKAVLWVMCVYIAAQLSTSLTTQW